MKTAALLLIALLVACDDTDTPTNPAPPLRHATVSLGVTTPVGDVAIEHTPTRIAWTLADPSNVGGLWTAASATKFIIPADWEAGRTLLLCAGSGVSGLTPGTEQAALVIEKLVTSYTPMAIQQATATADGYADVSLCVMDPHPIPGDAYDVMVYAYDAAHGQRVQAYYHTFFQAQQLSE